MDRVLAIIVVVVALAAGFIARGYVPDAERQKLETEVQQYRAAWGWINFGQQAEGGAGLGRIVAGAFTQKGDRESQIPGGSFVILTEGSTLYAFHLDGGYSVYQPFDVHKTEVALKRLYP